VNSGISFLERWKNVKGFKTLLGLAVVLIAVTGQQAVAQSTLFNIPSTDAVAKGKVYGEFDYFAQMPINSGASRLFTYVPRGVVGAGHGVEVGANVAGSHVSGATQWYLQPNFKWRFYGDDDKGVAASGGTILYTPLNNRSGLDTFGLAYGNFSKKIKSGNYGPRMTFGPYAVYSGGSAWAGAKEGVILGYEQPVSSKVTLLADWFSGKNFYGYFTPGVSFTLPHNSLFNAGYSIGNDTFSGNNSKNRLLFLYYGVTF
jgi:hypothetical protein